MTASDPCFLSVAEAASLIGSKRLSPVELTQAYLARIERLDGRLHCGQQSASVRDILPGQARQAGGDSALASASGAVGGALGLAALPVELPVSTAIMLRTIAEFARQEGEDLAGPRTRLACLEVFALGHTASLRRMVPRAQLQPLYYRSRRRAGPQRDAEPARSTETGRRR